MIIINLFIEGNTQQPTTDKPVALEFPIELEFRKTPTLRNLNRSIGNHDRISNEPTKLNLLS